MSMVDKQSPTLFFYFNTLTHTHTHTAIAMQARPLSLERKQYYNSYMGPI